MRAISKGPEPSDLKAWKRKNPCGCYENLPSSIRQTIRQNALEEQFYLCAYCCQRISSADGNECHNEHVEAQSSNPKRTLDFSNIVASCNTLKQCGRAHKSRPLPLTPLMAACEKELKFRISGRVEGLTDRARTTIEVLNLGDCERKNRALIGIRKRFSDSLLLANGVDPSEGLEDEELLKMLINDLSQPQKGKMEPFAPVVINILKNWLQS